MDKLRFMKSTEFNLTQDRLISMASFVREMDIEGFIRRIEAERKLGVILNEEIYRDLRDVTAVKDVALAANDFKKRIHEIRMDWRRRHARALLRGEHSNG